MQGSEGLSAGRALGRAPGRRLAILLGVLVTLLWASSVVLIRIGLTDVELDPLGFAGVRFTLAGIMLVPLAATHLRRAVRAGLQLRSLTGVLFYGLLMFGFAQISFHLALGTLSAATMGLMLGLTPVVTAALVLRRKHERPTLAQLLGVGVLVLGVVAYFGVEPPDRDQLGFLLIALVVPLVVGIASVVGRGLAVDIGRYGGPLGMTAVAMLAGGSFTLVAALVTEGIPAFEPRAWLLILWLAAVNTAFTYTLWTQVLRSLRAVEASVLGDLTVLMTAVLGWLVLGEALGPVEIAGLVLTVVGVAIVQLAPMLRTREGLRARP